MLRIQNVILEMIAKGEDLPATAERLCLEVEAIVPDAACSILTVDAAGLLHPLAAPSLPPDYSRALDGLSIGPSVGSCGTAAFLRADVAVQDIMTDPLWSDYRDLVAQLDYRACWSTPIRNGKGEVIGTFAFYYRARRGPTKFERDIVEACANLCVIAFERRDRVEEREKLARIDGLTGLPNRNAFNSALDALDCSQPGAWALLAIDLDNLKMVNDTFGHHAGDILLQEVAHRIADAAAPDRTFRIGGDEFAVIVQSPAALRDLDAMAYELLDRLLLPVTSLGHSLYPRATIGGAIVSEGDPLPQSVRLNADHALYHAKETGRGGFVRYWRGLGTAITQRLSTIQEVGVALREGRIKPYYQPVVRLDTAEIVGVEALCRMITPEGKVRTAGEFYEAMSDMDIAQAITDVMLENVANDVRHWLDEGIAFQHVGLNISSADLRRNMPIHEYLSAGFARANVPLKHLIVEVTEGVYLDDRDDDVGAKIAQMRHHGLKVALDDFGTGFASLTHLLTVPVDIIKIDRSFVAGLKNGSPSAAIVEGLSSIGQKLDIRLLAEGIETESQARHLLALGCRIGQGFLYSPAVSRSEMTKLLHLYAQWSGACRTIGALWRRSPDEMSEGRAAGTE